MSEISLILLSAGSSSRFGMGVKKQWLRVGSEPLWLFVAKQFERIGSFGEIIVVGDKRELAYMGDFADYVFIEGGKERQDSLKNAIEAASGKYVLSADVARCCVDAECVKRVIAAKDSYDCVVPAIVAADTVVFGDEYLDRSKVRLIQTPQLSKKEFLADALSKNIVFTDDSGAMMAAGYTVGFVEGSKKQTKLTTKEDLALLSCLVPPSNDSFCGTGFDTHAFEESGKPCKLGGVAITSEYGFKAHSDGDVLIHSIIDALLGAAGVGDIGEFFPDTDASYKDADSAELLRDVVGLIRGIGFEISNIDVTVIAEKPRLSRFKNEIKKNLAKIIEVAEHRICVKATTSEKMGFVGRGEGVAVLSAASLKFYDWTLN